MTGVAICLTTKGMSSFPATLKTWRKTRRFSQLGLALEAGVSPRHLSFLETGRASPSRQMIGRLGDVLDLPLSARNQMLVSAGYSARYPGRAFSEDDMAPILQAVAHMLDRHMPFPGLAVDRLWTVVRMNPAAKRLFGALGVEEGGSLLDLMTSGRLAEVVENWPELCHHVAQRLRTESVAFGGIETLDAAAAQLSQIPAPETLSSGPVVPTKLRLGDTRLSLFTTLAQFGTPEDLTLEELRIELYFPADAATKAFFEAAAV